MNASTGGRNRHRAAQPHPPPAGALGRLLAAGVALALAGCAPAPDQTASRVLEEVLESHRASMAAVEAPAEARSRGMAPVGRAAPGSVASLLGQSREGVIAVLGQPTRRRPEGDAEIWLYQGRNCAVDVVLYQDGAGRAARVPRVAWAAARASGTERRTEAGCLSELVAG
ncbi:hypothetical protein [Muricoccus vinaceus]|uniref:Lipoprotein SmpA/OmlA domain-containing protein n=1 Tax=Muricoccus vinaceus TaxID=424704 RepID=A0ABV6ISJ2_9PROT